MKVKPTRIVKKRVTWAKGHSSDSNPVTRKYRDVARAQLRIYGKGLVPVDHDVTKPKTKPAGLLSEQRSDAGDADDEQDEEEAGDAVSINSLDSALSDFTSCTNATFSKLHRNWDLGSAMHKDILAVLASVTEIIRNENGAETELEYFAALVSALSGPLAGEPSLLAATLYLLSLVIRRIPHNILRAKFKDVSAVLFPILVGSQNAPERSAAGGMEMLKTSVVRYAMTCTTSLLLAQGFAVWSEASVQRIVGFLLQLCVTDKPKLRKVAQKSLATILFSSSSQSTELTSSGILGGDVTATPAKARHHPASNVITLFCTNVLKSEITGDPAVKSSNSTFTTSADSSTKSTLHILNLLSTILPSLSAGNVRSLIESMLRLLTLDKPLVRFGVFQALESMLSRRPPPDVISLETCGAMVAALYDCRPALADSQLIVPWCAVMRVGHIVISDRDALMAVKCLPRLFEEYLALLRGCPDGCLAQIVDNFAISIDKCVGTVVDTEDSQFIEFRGNGTALSWHQDILSAVDQTLKSMVDLLSYQYVSIWPLALRLFAVFFTTVGRVCHTLSSFPPTLKSIAELRESDSIMDKRQLDIVIGAGIKRVGPDVILEAMSLKLPPNPPGGLWGFERSWLLPILRQNVGPGAHLDYFIVNLMPIAINYYDFMEKLKNNAVEGSFAQIRLLDTIQDQLWNVLPGFCKNPVDFADAFPKIAPVLGSLLVERPTLRLTILNTLRTTVTSLEIAENKPSLAIMTRFTTNYMPILISLYVNDTVAKEKSIAGYDAGGVHLSVFETMKLMVRIAPTENLASYLDVALQKISSKELLAGNKLESNEIRASVMDVLVVLASRLNSEQLKSAFFALKPHFSNQSARGGSLLKKSYRFLSEVLGLSAETVDGSGSDSKDSFSLDYFKLFIAENKQDLILVLSNIDAKASPATKACRYLCIGCMASFIGNQPVATEDGQQFLRSTLPDVVCGLTELSSRAKKCAAKALIQIFEALRRILSEDKDVSVGLKGFADWLSTDSLTEDATITVKTSCVIAFRLLVYEYRADASSAVASELCSKVIAVLRSSSEERPVVEAALSFVKTFVVSFPIVTVGQFLDIFLPPIFQLSEDCQHHFRFLVRKVLIKVVKKFSYEQVRQLVPEHHQKLLTNVRRIVARRQRQAESERAGARSRGVGNDIGEEDESAYDVASLTTAMSGVTTRVESIAELLEDSDSEPDSDDDGDRKSSVSRRSVKSAGGANSTKNSVITKRANKSVKVPVWMEEGTAEDVVDLMDSKAAQRVTTVNPTASHHRMVKSMKADRLKGFQTAADGRIIIAEGDEDAASGEESSDDDTKGDVKSMVAGSKRKRGAGLSDKGGKRAKRERGSDGEEEGDEGGGSFSVGSYKPGGKGIHRKSLKAGGKRTSGVKDKTAFYRSSKGKGDVKRKGAPDPYAYMPLDMGALNRRKKAKYHGQYKHLVQGARKGATKGSKHRTKRD